MTKQLPSALQNATAKIDEYARGMISGTGSTLFEELGFYYIGPVDGHNLQDLVDVLTGAMRWAGRRQGGRAGAQGGAGRGKKGLSVAPGCGARAGKHPSRRTLILVPLRSLLVPPTPAEIKTTETVGPVLLHVVTEKGRGYLPAESASDKMHGVVPYDTVTGKQKAGPKSSVRGCFGRLGGAPPPAGWPARLPWLQPTAGPQTHLPPHVSPPRSPSPTPTTLPTRWWRRPRRTLASWASTPPWAAAPA